MRGSLPFDSDRQPIQHVTVDLVAHPWFGRCATNDCGHFTGPVQARGGSVGPLDLFFQKLLTLHRFRHKLGYEVYFGFGISGLIRIELPISGAR